MPRFRRLSGREVCRIPEAHGFVQVRQRGSHVVMQRKLPDTTITVPVPDHREVKPGTPSSIIRQSQVARAAFETD